MKQSTQNIVQFVSAIALALMLGLTLAHSADAQKYAKGTTQASSIQNAKDMCAVGGGSQTVTDSPFEGVKISKCSGGDMDGYTCGHGQKSVNCSYQIVTPNNGGIIINPSVKNVEILPGTTFEINAQPLLPDPVRTAP